MKKDNVRYVQNLPIECVKLAEKRTVGILQNYGRWIDTMDVKVLTASCYLQGISDYLQYQENRTEPEYSI